jgi:uncharacterized RDD family membrane protein YckC
MNENPFAVSTNMDSPYVGSEHGCCPLCGLDKNMKKPMPLYDTLVCKKCLYKFANRRQIAYIIDNVLFRIALLPVVIGIAVAVQQLQLGGAAEILANLSVWLLIPIFFFKDGFSGYSLGKLICGVRLMNVETGKPGGFGMSFVRNLPMLIPFVVVIMAFQLQKGNRWGDRWTKSKVIWMKYKDHPIFSTNTPHSSNA